MASGTRIDFSAYDDEAKVFTVVQYIEILNTFLKRETVRITGEVSELKRAASGHVYFTVKDKDAPGVIDCIIWSRNYELCGVVLEVGMEVILSGHPNIYAPSGRLSFVAGTVELVGEGALKKAYEALRKKLEAEGAFAEARKRPLPEYVARIGVVTSMKGAVIHDFMNNLGRYGFRVRAIDARVEGQQSVGPLRAAIRAMRAQTVEGGTAAEDAIEALVVIRGGGSLESLQGFNNEVLVREVIDFPVPVIAGIGHDQDIPLMALAADYMTSTPTAAAHLLNRSWEMARMKLEQFSRIHVRIGSELTRVKADLALARSALVDHMTDGLARLRERLAHAEQVVRLNDPARQLALGYAIARKGGKVLRSARQLAHGDAVDLQLEDGTVRTRVDKAPLL
jgi:exodeoxyribonuclease VII large subunit